MKKYIIFIASAVLMMTACVKEEINTTITGETEFISVELSPVTKTQLSVSDKTTNWTEGDAVSVTVGGKELGRLKLTKDNVFEGEIEAGHDGEATINYPAGVTTVPPTQDAVDGSFAEEAALLEGTTTLDELRKGNGPELQNKTALLQFSVAEAGDVTFEVGDTKYTVKGCKVGSTYYACVAPATAKLTARIGGYLLKSTSANKTFTAGYIAILGQLPAKEKFGWGLVGQHQGWDITNPTAMYKVYDGTGNNNVNDVYAALGITLSDNGFKFAKFGLSNWNTANTYFGAWTKSSGKQYYNFTNDCGLGNWYDMWTDSCGGQPENIGVADWSQQYDVYIKMTDYYTDSQHMYYTIVKAGTTSRSS